MKNGQIFTCSIFCLPVKTSSFMEFQPLSENFTDKASRLNNFPALFQNLGYNKYLFLQSRQVEPKAPSTAFWRLQPLRSMCIAKFHVVVVYVLSCLTVWYLVSCNFQSNGWYPMTNSILGRRLFPLHLPNSIYRVVL